MIMRMAVHGSGSGVGLLILRECVARGYGARIGAVLPRRRSWLHVRLLCGVPRRLPNRLILAPLVLRFYLWGIEEAQSDQSCGQREPTDQVGGAILRILTATAKNLV